MLVLEGPHRLVRKTSKGFEVVYSFALNLILVCFPSWQCLHITFEGFLIFGKFLIAPRFLTFTILSKLICPNLLFYSQLSSTKFTWHSSFNFASSIYTFSGVLGAIPTNFPMSYLLISHFWESKMQKCPWS